MCGIFGIVNPYSPVFASEFIDLAETNKHRGNLAFGYLQSRVGIHDAETTVSHHPTPFTPSLVDLAHANVALAHIRAPIGGRANLSEEVHPFTIDRMHLAHNGLLLNHEQHTEWRFLHNSNIDSQYILGGIAFYARRNQPLAEAIATTVSQLDGQQACWLWSQKEHALYLWRVMSPIYYRRSDTRFIFSSSRHQQIQTLLSEGTVYRLDPLTLTLTTPATFTYYSPYKTRS